MPALDILCLYTKFGNFHFSRSEHMIVGILKMGQMTLNTPFLGAFCHAKYRGQFFHHKLIFH